MTSDPVATLVLQYRVAIATCDAISISCTNLLVLDRVQQLEAELDKSVVASNYASLWAALKRLGLFTTDIAYGRLFAPEAS